MDQQAFLNEYINQISTQCKTLTMEKIMLTTQNTLLAKQVEDLTKLKDELLGQIEESQKKVDKKKVKEEVNEFTN